MSIIYNIIRLSFFTIKQYEIVYILMKMHGIFKNIVIFYALVVYFELLPAAVSSAATPKALLWKTWWCSMTLSTSSGSIEGWVDGLWMVTGLVGAGLTRYTTSRRV
jgi:hypothetical protein